MTLTPRLLSLALHCADQELKARAAGKPPGVQPWNAELVRALEFELAVSRSGHDRVDVEQDWDPQEWLSASEVAATLGLSKRQITRIAADLGGQIIGGRWLFPTAAVNEYAEGRRHGRSLPGSGAADRRDE